MLHVLRVCQANVAAVPPAFSLSSLGSRSKIQAAGASHVVLLHFLMSLSLYSHLDKLEEVHRDFNCQMSLSETEVRGGSAKVNVQSGCSDSYRN